MMTRPPAPGEPPAWPGGQCHGGDRAAAWRAMLAGMWALVLDRFRDYERFRDYPHVTKYAAAAAACDPSNEPGGQHDPDT